MDVYYNTNGNFWRRGRQTKKLTAFSIQKTFLWGNLKVHIPAVYTGRAGAILDVCIKIPAEEMIAFLNKWSKGRRLSLRTQEDYERMEADNPCCIDFESEMYFNDQPLQQGVRSSLMWYPKTVFELDKDDEITPAARSTEFYDEDEDGEEIPTADEWQNDKDAEKLMTAYDCDRNFCWYFARLFYEWDEEMILSPKKVFLILKAETKSVTTTHFTTDFSCSDQKIKLTHPVTGEEYVLTLYECKERKLPFSDFGEKGMCYPTCCQELSYGISLEPECGLLDIRDCNEGDEPKREGVSDKVLSENCGATAFFVAGKTESSDKSVAFSSLHFEPVHEVHWRVVFQIKPREDAVVSFDCQKS